MSGGEGKFFVEISTEVALVNRRIGELVIWRTSELVTAGPVNWCPWFP